MSKDRPRREVKKSKKDAKKENISPVTVQSADVEVVRKTRKPKEEQA